MTYMITHRDRRSPHQCAVLITLNCQRRHTLWSYTKSEIPASIDRSNSSITTSIEFNLKISVFGFREPGDDGHTDEKTPFNG